jgi:uncharacterized protein
VIALLAGVLFALGLLISGIASPANVIGFLDVGGDWKPALLIVMISATVVYAPFARFAKLRYPPAQTPIDAKLVGGAAIFGIGWGLSGYCPGPALVSTGGAIETGVFVLAMIAGMAIARRVQRSR